MSDDFFDFDSGRIGLHRPSGATNDLIERLLPGSARTPSSHARLSKLLRELEGSDKELIGVSVEGAPGTEDWESMRAKLAGEETTLLVAAKAPYLDTDARELIETGSGRLPDFIDDAQIVQGDTNDIRVLEPLPPPSVAYERMILGPNNLIRVPPRPPATTEENAVGGKATRPLLMSRISHLGRAVCRVESWSRPRGTGVLLSDNRILTARHVLPSMQAIETATVVFDHCGPTVMLSRFRVDPNSVQFLPEELDAVIVGLTAIPGPDRPRVPLGRLLDPAVPINIDDETVIIQHPAGRPLSAVVDNTRVVDVGDARFQYEADTLRGSSGAPVFRKTDLGLAGVHVQGGHLDKLSADGLRLTNEGVLATAIAGAAL